MSSSDLDPITKIFHYEFEIFQNKSKIYNIYSLNNFNLHF